MNPLAPEGFAEVQRETLEQKISVYPARSWYPSQVGHPCERFLVWRFLKWEQQQAHDYVLQSIFDEGNLHQPSVYARLEAMGFDIVREQDRPTQYTVRGGGVISGRPDGKIRGFRGEKFLKLVVLEIKSAQSHAWERIDTIEDIRHANEHYVRNYFDQGNLYCFLDELDQGVIVLKNKATGLLKIVPFSLDYEAAEKILERIERLQEMVQAKQDPPPIPYDTGICGRCAFSHLCYPPRDLGTGLVPLDDSAMLQLLEEREQTKAAADEYAAADKAIKAQLKRLGTFTQAMCGEFLVTRTEVPVREYTVKARTDVRFTIERLDGQKRIGNG